MSLSLAGALAAAAAATALALAVGLRDLEIDRWPHPDAAALRDGGWTRGTAQWEGVRVIVVVLASVLCRLIDAPPLLAAFGALAPSIWIRLRAEAARERARRAFGHIVRAAEGGVRSGLALPEALRRAVEATAGEPLASGPVSAALRAFELGAGLDEALILAAARSDAPIRVALGSIALAIGEALPRERIAELLASVSDRAAFDERLTDEVRARTSGARQQQWLLAALVPALAAYLALTVPTLGATLGSDLGRFVLVPAATLLEVAGYVVGRRIVRAGLP